jgi:uncharacterized protein YbjT (DUF2867 family)
MVVVIAGGHGQIALRLERVLAGRGDTAKALVRKEEQFDDVRAAGGEPVLFDLEQQEADELAPLLEGADAVVFAAGAGPGSGPARKKTVDEGAAVKLVDAAKAAGVKRYVIVSSIGAQDLDRGEGDFRAYLQAKAAADAAVAGSGLDYTIVRPGSLTNDPGDGKVELNTDLGRTGSVTRDDVAAVLAATLSADNTIGKTFEVFDGDTPIDVAIAALWTLKGSDPRASG